MTAEELEQLLRTSEPADIFPFLDNSPNLQPSKVVQSALKLLKVFYNELYDKNVSWNDWSERSQRYQRQQLCGCLTVYRLGNWTDIKKMMSSTQMNGRDFEQLCNLLYPWLERDRPAWLNHWAEALFLDGYTEVNWPWIRRLVKAGLIDRQATDNYLIKMPRDLDFLRANPELLQDEVFGLFRTVPKTYKILFADSVVQDTGESYDSTRWDAPFSWTLGRLCKEGLIDRSRLLSASLEALQIGRHPLDCTWFYKFHEFLEPTPAERAALQQVYCDLLTVDVPTVVAFALDALDVLLKAGQLDSAMVLAVIDRVFGLKNKGTATSALKLLEQMVKRDKSLAADVAVAAATGLAHETPDVQKATLKTLEGLKLSPDERVAAAIQSRMGSVVASFKERAQTLLDKLSTGSPAPAAPKSGPRPAAATVPIPAEVVPPLVAASRIADENQITPTLTLDELITEASGAIANWNGGAQLERVMDGLSRLCGERPVDFAARVKPLSKRINKLFDDWKHINAIERDLVGRLMVTIQVWLQDSVAPNAASPDQDVSEPVPPAPLYLQDVSADSSAKSQQDVAFRRSSDDFCNRLEKRLALTFLDGRLTELESWIGQGPGRPLLSAPTHRGGWISAAAFVERLQAYERAGLDPRSYDLRQALLRLAPEDRDEVLRSATGLTGSRQKAFQWALDTLKPSTIAEAAVYIAAKAGREPTAPLLVSETPVVLEPLSCSWYVIKSPYSLFSQEEWVLTLKISPDPFQSPLFRFPPLTLWPIAHHAERIHFPDGKATRLAEIWPGNLTPFFGTGAVAIVAQLETTNNQVKFLPEFLSPLFDSHVEFSEMAQLMLACASLAKSTDLRGLALDGLIAVVNDGRCQGPELGVIYRRLLPSGMVRVNRLSEPLQTAARSSPLHMQACALLVQAMFSEIEAIPDEAHHLLTPLLDWLAELQRPLEGAFHQALTKTSGSGKTAKLAKALLKHHETLAN